MSPYKPLSELNWKNFSNKNLQTPSTDPNTLSINMTGLMGAKAKTPEATKTAPVASLPKAQQQPNTPPTQSSVTPPITTPNPQPAPQNPQPYQQSAPQGNTFSNNVRTLGNTATQGTPLVQQAIDNLRNFKTGYAESQGKIASQPIPLEFQQGRAQVIANQYSQQLPAYEQAVQNSLTSQGQQLSGLTSAATLSQPQQVPLTSQPFYPVEGNFSNAGGGVGTRATQAANIGSLQQLVPQYQQMQANFKGIENLQAGVKNLLQVKDLNPTSFPYINASISNILQRGVGDPNYKELENYMNDLASRYAVYFGASGEVTNQVRNVASSLVNGTASPEAISQVLAGLDTQANAVMQGVYQQIQNIQSNPQGVTAPTAPTTAPTSASVVMTGPKGTFNVPSDKVELFKQQGYK